MISVFLCNLGDLLGDWDLIGIALLFLGEEAWFSLILLKAEGEGKLVSLERLIELSLPMDLALEKPLELLVLLPRPFFTSLRGAGAPDLSFSSIDLCPGGAGILDPTFVLGALGIAEAPLAGLGGTEGILGYFQILLGFYRYF